MILYNITILMLLLNHTNVDYADHGLMRVDYRAEYRNGVNGMFTPQYGGRGIISIWTPNKEEVIPILEHELKHLRCWREEGSKGWINNSLHKGCFQK